MPTLWKLNRSVHEIRGDYGHRCAIDGGLPARVVTVQQNQQSVSRGFRFDIDLIGVIADDLCALYTQVLLMSCSAFDGKLVLERKLSVGRPLRIRQEDPRKRVR